MGDKYGRKIPFVISIALTALFGLISTVSPNFPFFLTFRSLVSIGIGGLGALDYTLFTEFTPKVHRGKFTLIVTIAGALGVLFCAGMAWIFIPLNLDIINGWRIFIAIQAMPSLIIFIFRLIFSEETPRYLIGIGDVHKAYRILENIIIINKVQIDDLLPEKEVLFEAINNNRKYSDQYETNNTCNILCTIYIYIYIILDPK